MELCSYSVRPPNEPRPSFGGFLLTSLYYPDSISTLLLHCAPLFARGLPIPESAPSLDGQANLCNGAIFLSARSCRLKFPLTERIDHVRLAGYFCGLGNGQAV